MILRHLPNAKGTHNARVNLHLAGSNIGQVSKIHFILVQDMATD